MTALTEANRAAADLIWYLIGRADQEATEAKVGLSNTQHDVQVIAQQLSASIGCIGVADHTVIQRDIAQLGQKLAAAADSVRGYALALRMARERVDVLRAEHRKVEGKA